MKISEIKQSRTRQIEQLRKEVVDLENENKELKRLLKLYDGATLISQRETGTDEVMFNTIESEFFGSFGLKKYIN